MSSKTTNYDLNKYTSDDGILATVAGLSANMDIIDTNMGGVSDYNDLTNKPIINLGDIALVDGTFPSTLEDGDYYRFGNVTLNGTSSEWLTNALVFVKKTTAYNYITILSSDKTYGYYARYFYIYDNSSNEYGLSSNRYSLPTASTSTLGGVKIDGTSIKISNGVISAKDYIDTQIGNIDTLLTNMNTGGGVS